MLPKVCYWYSDIVINIPSLMPTCHMTLASIIYKEIYTVGCINKKNQTVNLTIIKKLNKNIKSLIIFQKKFSHI